MSALTNVITGHLARVVDTFKENEAALDRIVRGRQILFMLHDHFSANIKHGATYALEDLFSITLRNDNLRAFMSAWDQVLAGITHIPSNEILETLFYKQVKNSRSIAHDLNEYHRAEEGSEKHSYKFLLEAVRRHLDRERLESNRDRVARNLAGSARASAPAVGEKKQFIPKGFCIKWNRGGCSDDNCKFKHETPQPRQPGRGRDPSRGSSRGRSPSGKGSGNKEDATEVMSANSNMKAKQGNLGRLPQLGQVLMIQKAVVKVEGKDVEAEVGQGPNPRSHQSRLNHQRTALDRTQPRPRKPRPRHPLPQCV